MSPFCILLELRIIEVVVTTGAINRAKHSQIVTTIKPTPSCLYARCPSCHPAPCGLRGCKNGPAPFPGRMSYKATKPGLALSVVYLNMFYVLLIIRSPFYVLLVFVAMCSVFWLFWLSYQYLPSDWPERLL